MMGTPTVGRITGSGTNSGLGVGVAVGSGVEVGTGSEVTAVAVAETAGRSCTGASSAWLVQAMNDIKSGTNAAAALTIGPDDLEKWGMTTSVWLDEICLSNTGPDEQGGRRWCQRRPRDPHCDSGAQPPVTMDPCVPPRVGPESWWKCRR